MDNPNNSGRIRRCNSLPSKVQRTSSLLPSRLRMKTNPYVGSFRHSPPTTFRSMEAGFGSQQKVRISSPYLRNSPYIGWFRHAPPSKLRLHKVNQKELDFLDRCCALAMILEGLPQPEKTHPGLSKIINGRLRGGGRDKCYQVQTLEHNSFIKAVHGALEESSNAASSTTVKVLAKLGAWLLLPLAHDTDSDGYRSDFSQGLKLLQQDATERSEQEYDIESEGGSAADSDDESSIALSDFDGPVTRPEGEQTYSSQSPKIPLNVSVSEVAEAYYAHQEVDQSEYSGLEGHRLDYVITQMDIARMARNASRHLDVESILRLPTVTYRAPVKSQKPSMIDSKETDSAWSFVIVPQTEKSSATAIPDDEGTPDNVCVICLDPFVDGDRLRVLPCDHSFHSGCIDRWLSGSHSHHECFTSGCPTCKTRPTESITNDGSVPSWAFAKLGAELARSSTSLKD